MVNYDDKPLYRTWKGKRVQAGYFNTKAEAIVARQKLMAENWSN